MSGKKLGRQTPTKSVVLPYTKSKGSEAVEIYNKSGRTAQILFCTPVFIGFSGLKF